MRCPGQDMRYWKFDSIYDVKCPYCGATIEFFKDDSTKRCKNCGKQVPNPKMDFGCAAYCQFAEQCLGNLPPELLKNRDDLLKNRVAVEMKKHFKKDFKRISHTLKISRYAEQIGKDEGVPLGVVLCAAYLADFKDLEKAREILQNLGAKEELIENVMNILSGKLKDKSFEVINDAKVIADIQEKAQDNGITKDEIQKKIENEILTETGRKKAKTLFPLTFFAICF